MTLRRRLDTSVIRPAVVSVPMRRLSRPGGRLARALPAAPAAGSLLARIDAGEISPAPALTIPPGLVTTDELADTVPAPPAHLPGWIPRWLARWLIALKRAVPALAWLLAAVALAAAIAGIAVLAAGGAAGVAAGVVLLAVAVVIAAIALAVSDIKRAANPADLLRPDALTVAAIDRLPPAPGFVLVSPGDPVPVSSGSTDSPTAARFKNALRDWHALHEASVAADVVPAPTRYGAAGLARLAAATVAAIDPATTVPARVLGTISLPEHVRADLGEEFAEVMAYPRIDQPMYAPLKDISDELLLPNLNLIPQNTVTLLETNQPFIEAYMVGLNHEMARELLWREYPTDQRGTPFRQFWDVRGARTPPGADARPGRGGAARHPAAAPVAEASHLGDHNNRATAARRARLCSSSAVSCSRSIPTR